jgi:hypothetical protein
VSCDDGCGSSNGGVSVGGGVEVDGSTGGWMIQPLESKVTEISTSAILSHLNFNTVLFISPIQLYSGCRYLSIATTIPQ